MNHIKALKAKARREKSREIRSVADVKRDMEYLKHQQHQKQLARWMAGLPKHLQSITHLAPKSRRRIRKLLGLGNTVLIDAALAERAFNKALEKAHCLPRPVLS